MDPKDDIVVHCIQGGVELGCAPRTADARASDSVHPPQMQIIISSECRHVKRQIKANMGPSSKIVVHCTQEGCSSNSRCASRGRCYSLCAPLLPPPASGGESAR